MADTTAQAASDVAAAHREPTPTQAATAAVAAVDAALDVLTRVDPGDVDSTALHALLRETDAQARRLAGLRARLLPAIEEDGRWAAGGARSFSAWVRQTTSSSAREASRLTRTARSLRDHLPGTAAALADGSITAEHAQLLATHTTRTPERVAALAHPEVGEDFLLTQARRFDASDFARLVRSWAVAADPAGADAGYAAQADRHEVVLAKTLHGYHLQGWLTDVDGATLDAALRAAMGTPAAEDRRTTSERRATALVTLARSALDGGRLQSGAAIRPHLSVHVPYDTLTRLVQAQDPGARARRAGHATIPGELDPSPLTGADPGELDDGTPLPPTVLARLACDSEIGRVVFGPTGEVLDVGRARRLFTPGQRRGIIARDRTCRFPGCDAPPAHGEIHHSIWWYAQHGGTSTDNGVLLCWFHHDYVHRHRITITRHAGAGAPGVGTAPGARSRPQLTWTFTRPNGSEVSAAPVRGSPRAA